MGNSPPNLMLSIKDLQNKIKGTERVMVNIKGLRINNMHHQATCGENGPLT